MNKTILLVGATASGKSSAAEFLAKHFEIEIISADARQIYRYLDIGTATPPQTILNQIPHHLINILNPDQYYNAAQFAEDASRIIKQIQKINKIPIIVGGSGFYIKALIDGLSKLPKDLKCRERLKKEIEINGIEYLHNYLNEIDPETAKRLASKDAFRIIRAIEVYELTGKPLSMVYKEYPPQPLIEGKYLIIGLDWERKFLYERINKRVDLMIDNGLIEEVKFIENLGYDKNLSSLQSIGYKEIWNYLDGTISLDETIEKIKINTRHYAKKQLTWFRKDKRIHWLDAHSKEKFQYLLKEKIEYFLQL